MTGAGRASFDAALHGARLAAYPAAGFVGQESFMRAGEILTLARRAGVGPGVSVLDLCCGVGGAGRFITAELGCAYLGVDSSAGAVQVARDRAATLPCRFEVSRVPPLPAGRFDVVLLLETMLAFRDKNALLRGVAAALPVGGRFAFTLEEGQPLTPAEREAMPEADTVWLVPLPQLVSQLTAVGLRVIWLEECTTSHRLTADALADAFVIDRPAIARRVGVRRIDALIAAHRLWGAWLAAGRARKFAIVAERTRFATPSTDRSKS